MLAARSAPGPVPAWPAGEVLRSGRPVRLSAVAEQFGPLPSGGWPHPPAEAMVLPLHGDGGDLPVGVMVLAASAGRALDSAYQDFLGLVARQTAALVNGTVAYQAQLHRAEELAELDRAKTTFFSNISHEFRTPLTLIMGPLAELRGRLDPADETARTELDVIQRNGLRLGRLVNSLLDFSRIEAGRMRASYQPVDLSAGTAELASVFRSAVEHAGLRYQVDCPPLSGPVEIDREMWEKIVLNLLSNALKFTFDGSIAVTLGEQDGMAELRVADTGTGIPAAELPRLFDRFHRVENARARSNEGSGIGLALVRELVGLHGGTISVHSEEQAGTEFTVRIPFRHAADGTSPAQAASVAGGPPLAAADPFVQEAMRWLVPGDAPGAGQGAGLDAGGGTLEEAAARAADGSKPAVLLADDNADMREYLERLLRPGYQVTAVTDGQRALNAARAHPPDLVISDVMMPELDGLELVGALRADPRTADVPVLLLSARAGQEAAIEGLGAGADDYLVKPFAAAELLARVRTTIELSRMRGEHARWRAALIESLHEAFFLCDSSGAVIEVNSAFAGLLGWGPDDLPYPAPQPWWPDRETEPEERRLVDDAFERLTGQPGGSFTVPVKHRDGHWLWISGSFNETTDREGTRLVVGTFRDDTAEHYAIQRETALAALGQALAQADTMAETLHAGLGELHRLWNARRAVAAIWSGAAEPLVSASDPGLSWGSLPATAQAGLTVLRDRPPLTPAAEQGGAGVSLEHPEGILAIWIELPAGHPLSTEDQTLLTLLGSRLGQALQRAHQNDEQRQTALALQRAILGPAQLPAGFSARYEPASRPLEVGGDWHDITLLPDGRIAIVVGDCVGHDLGAATVMGQLRSACRALLLQDGSPARALMALDRFAASVPGADGTTVFCGVLDPETGSLTYSAAGHPPGIVADPDGGTELLEGGRAFPLAVTPDIERTEASYLLPPRATLLLYTDGLIERRGHALTEGIVQAAAEVAAGGEDTLEDLATGLMTRLAPSDGYRDDMAIVLYRHPAPLELAFPADTDELRPARARLRNWLDRCVPGTLTAQDSLVAAGEAVANAIEHGHRERPGEVRLRASVTAQRLRMTVVDTGSWLPPGPEPTPFRGKGITLMRAMMDNVSIDAGPAGTTVTMDVRISRDDAS